MESHLNTKKLIFLYNKTTLQHKTKKKNPKKKKKESEGFSGGRRRRWAAGEEGENIKHKIRKNCNCSTE